jgi:hypothetical protein
LIGHRRGDPNEVGETLAIFGTAGVRFDALKQRPRLCGAEMDFVEASEQFEALKHGALHLRRDQAHGLGFRCLVERINAKKSSWLVGRRRSSPDTKGPTTCRNGLKTMTSFAP